jgi:TolB-like protein/DNA-binding winged helix-turn-helix (wHTH) protein
MKSPTPEPQALPPEAATRYRAGDLLIDLGRQRVTRADEVIALPKLSFKLLVVLVGAAPNLISSEALLGQVWPKVVVSPETLNQRVKLLRDALGDDPRNPRYIEGLRGRGYRWAPAVEISVAGEEPKGKDGSLTAAPPAGMAAMTPARPSSRIRPWLLPLAAVMLIAAAWLSQYLRREPIARRPPTSVAVVAVQPRAVAVLPFDNLSPTASDNYIALGVADSVRHQLASVPQLIVIARSSSVALGQPTRDPLIAARRLGVRYVVQGSVQRAGSALRVTAQLIDTQSDRELWSLKLDRRIDELFALQDQIAERIARQLDVTLHGGSSEYARYGTDAYLAFLRGRALVEGRTIASVSASIQQFSRAIELAPSFAPAIAELARARLLLSDLHGGDPKEEEELWREVNPMINRAIALDPRAGPPYFMRAQYRLDIAHDVPGAEADFRTGVDLAPNFGPGLRLYAQYLFDESRVADALAMIDRARLVDPLGPENHYFKGEILRRGLGDREGAVALYLQAIAAAPNFYPAYARLGQVRAEEGRLAEAIQYAEKAVAIEPKVGWPRDRLLWFYVDIGDLPAARDVLRGYVSGSPEGLASEALLCYRAGRLDRADGRIRAAIGQPEVDADGMAVVLATDAIVKRAIARRDAVPARRFILSMRGLKKEGSTLAVVADNWPAVVQLATLESLAGDRRVGDGIARRVLDFLDRGGTFGGLPGGDDWARASAAGLLGRNDVALASLAKLARSNRIGWWARIEGNPALDALGPARSFRAIEQDDRMWLESEQRALGRLRSQHDVPLRSAAGLTPAGC